MTIESDNTISFVVAFLTTYVLHSSLLVGIAWCVCRMVGQKNHAFSEKLWKTAAIAGLMTTPFQLYSDCGIPIFEFNTSSSSNPNAGLVIAARKHLATNTTSRSNIGLREHQVSKSKSSEVDIDIAKNEDGFDGSESAHFPSNGSSGDDLYRENNSIIESSDGLPAEGTQSSQERRALAGAADGWLPLMPAANRIIMLLISIFVVVSLGRLLWNSRCFRRRLSDCQIINSGPLRRKLDELLLRAGCRRYVSLLSTKRLDEPAAFGILKWRIVLPIGIESQLEPDELEAMLAHEVAHLVRGDTVWLWFGRILCSCFAVQPLNFLARREWQRAAEFECDEWAIRHHVHPLSLAKCLTHVAEWRIHGKNCHAALSVGGQQSNLGDRIEHLVEHPGPRKGTVRNWPLASGALLMVGALFACAVWGPRTHLQAKSTKRLTVDSNSTASIEGALHESSAGVKENNEISRAEIQDNVTMDELGEFPADGQASFDRTREQLAALDNELQLLENELQDLRYVIGQSVGVETNERLAAQLSERIDELRRHRELLFHELVKN